MLKTVRVMSINGTNLMQYTTPQLPSRGDILKTPSKHGGWSYREVKGFMHTVSELDGEKELSEITIIVGNKRHSPMGSENAGW